MPDYNEEVGGAVGVPLPKARVLRDEDAESPRAWDNLGVMACWHKRYKLGDVQPREEPADWLKENAPKGSIVLPLSLYDHSGITMRVGPPTDMWDSGYVGYIVATPEAMRKCAQVKRISQKMRADFEAQLRQEVETYDDFLTGNVWGFIIEGGPDDGEGCWGFFGEPTTLEAMKSHVSKTSHEALEAAWGAAVRPLRRPG